MTDIAEKIRSLPPDLQRKVEAYVTMLQAQNISNRDEPAKFEWAGALKDHYKEYDSVRLQHEASRLRSD